ncbi:non-ribosomal peptide synthetase (plasmid) [Kitasatospora sp. NBC_00070]|uniref:non-ribosomal peptide synthetase n=1 Tax=Kitasatospora sp. NBC_00070 TaxID=2975962 RepID=UPI002F90ADE0
MSAHILDGVAPARPSTATPDVLPAASDPGFASIPALIAALAERAPHALAVTDGTVTLTYGELVAAAGRLAAELTRRGTGPGSAVGLLAARSARLVVAQLAVWWTGAHSVPLDPAYPQPRTAEMIADAGVSLVLGDKALLAETQLATGQGLELSEDGTVTRTDASSQPTAPEEVDPRSVALVFYTSGSTGHPKGVQVPHSAVANLATASDPIRLAPGDRVLAHSPLTFDASTFELWAPLVHGAAVALSPADRPTGEELARDIERFGVTHAFLTTALFHHLATRRSRAFGVLRTLVAGGETMSPEIAADVLGALPWLNLLNAYGPTEATTFTTLHQVTPADCAAPIPIGRPFGGARTAVLDERQGPVPPGTRGELWIGGGRLALGYLGQPELTADRFRTIPGLGRMYRSGDLAVQRPDGDLEFHGRVDHQVKVRGFRIEPGETEHALRQHPDLTEAVVVVRRAGHEDAALTAYVVPTDGHRPTAETLRRQLAERLPDHLVPTAWTVLDRLPLTPNGKIDRRALAEDPAPATRPTPAAPQLPAGLTPIQQAVAEAWSRSLGRPVTDPGTDFLTEGGHSLLALWIVDDLREDLDVELTLADFFAHPTIAGQATLVERALLTAEGAGPPDGSHPADVTDILGEDW